MRASCWRDAALFLALGLFGLPFVAAGQDQRAAKPRSAVLEKQKTPVPEKPTPIRIIWVGDIVMETAWRQPPAAPQSLFGGVRKRLMEADLVIANLEGPLTDSPEMTPYKSRADLDTGKDVVLRTTSPEAAQALFDGGIRVVGLANNHTMDYVERGLRDTMRGLRKAGVLYAGAGENLKAAEAPRIVKIKGQRIGIISFSDVVPKYSWALADKPGIATAKEAERVVAAVRRARPSVDLLVMVFHWGVQFDREASARQIFLAQEAQRAGADVVLGAHPHVLQGVGCLERVPVVYSAGNFAFPTSSLPTRRTALFEFEYSSGKPLSLRLVPVMIDARGAPQLADGATSEEILSGMSELSLPLGFHLDGDSGSCSDAPPAPAQSVEDHQPH